MHVPGAMLHGAVGKGGEDWEGGIMGNAIKRACSNFIPRR